MFQTIRSAVLLLLLAPLSAGAAVNCADVLKVLGASLADINCFASADLTTNNPQTTPANDSLPGVPPFAFTPITDRSVIAPSAGKRTPIIKAVPGVQLDARIASDPQGQARFLLRLPNDWNGRLVVAGASGTRSEFNGDFAWSDYVVQKGYAYASQNKGVLNLRLSATVAGTMDALLPIDHHARAYARKVAASAKHKGHGHGNGDDKHRPAYRLYEVQNGNHIETYQDTFPQLELLEPHAQHAFDLLVQHVEGHAPLPPDQCVPHGGKIADAPAQPGHCASLFVP